MAGTIKLNRKEWKNISDQLVKDCPRSWTTITYVQKRELGFTVRYHKEPVMSNERTGEFMYYKETICLDFYDDVKETFFRMKYL